jgi:hypothetical protein
MIPWEKIDAEAWRHAFQKLAISEDWIQMKQLVVDESRELMSLCGKDVDVSKLIEYCHGKDHEHMLWGQKLAIALMERGSPFPKTSDVALMKKALDFGIDKGKTFTLINSQITCTYNDIGSCRALSLKDNFVL